MLKKEKLKTLKWWDISILTLILFGKAIYDSTIMYLELFRQGMELQIPELEFSVTDNYKALFIQFILLTTGFIYLKFRNFDFSQWNIKISLKAVLFGILLFIILALCMDVYFFAVEGIFYIFFPNKIYPSAFQEIFMISLFSTILYSILNGFYEEIYFLGICMAVSEKNIRKSFLFSIIVRFLFHTYQGLVPAIGIGLILGIVYYLMYTKLKIKNMVPYFVSHIIADIFGIGVLWYFIN